LDTNFQDPALGRQTGAKSGLGLADVLENGTPRDLSDVLQKGDSPNLYVLTTGRKRVNAVSFIDNPEFESILASLRRSFRFILMDGPPLLGRPEAIHLAARADGVILVVRQGRLKREVLQKAMQTVQSVNAPVLGAVLNRRRFAIPDFVYKLIS
jgi:Mrp family chromosome partitioning ATPase